MSEKISISYSELAFYLMCFCFIGARAAGLQELQWPFTVAVVVGFICFVSKIIVTKWNFSEFCTLLLLLLVGIVTYLRNGHLDALVIVCFLAGMKSVKLEKALKLMLAIWSVLFVITVGRSLLGIMPGMISPQKKIGMDTAILRYSLGYSHPNVLHITYFVIMLLWMYFSHSRGKKLIIETVAYTLGNLYVFLYSVSYTGLLVTFFAIILNVYISYKNEIKKWDMVIGIGFIMLCVSLTTVLPLILPDKFIHFLDTLSNYRFSPVKEVFTASHPGLLGKPPVVIENVWTNLDSSYPYLFFFSGSIVGFVILAGFIGSFFWAVTKDKKAYVVFVAMALSGVTEQYMGNLSFRNISLLFIGYWLFNEIMPRFDRYGNQVLIKKTGDFAYPSFDRVISLANIEKSFASKKKVIGFMMTGSLILLLVCLLIWHEPTKLYIVNGDFCTFIYDGTKTIPNDTMVIGDLADGCCVYDCKWVDLSLETVRIYISSIIWGSFDGVIAYLICLRLMTNKVVAGAEGK